jgi:protein-S-isoprenylcysteine O-methyltransferase Ste14
MAKGKTNDDHFSYSRPDGHPAYLGLALLLLGIPLSSGSVIGLGIAIFGGIPAVLYRIRVEERFLVEIFGKQYQEYAEKTWKILPFIW